MNDVEHPVIDDVMEEELPVVDDDPDDVPHDDDLHQLLQQV